MQVKSSILSILLSFVAPHLYAETVTQTFKADQIKGFTLANGSGNNLIQGKNIAEAKIEAQKIKWHDNCELHIESAGNRLKAIVSQKKSTWFNECQVNFHITLPPHVDLLLQSGSGNTKVYDLSGDIELTTGSGDIYMERMAFERLKLQSGSGNVKIDGEINQGEIKIGSGDINLTYRNVPVNGELSIKSGSGNTTIHMPGDARIKVDYQAGSGKLTSELDQLHNAPYSVFMKAGSGNLHIKKL